MPSNIHAVVSKYFSIFGSLLNSLFLLGWDGGMTIMCVSQMTQFINFIGQKTVQSQALDVWAGQQRLEGSQAKHFYARSFSMGVSSFGYIYTFFGVYLATGLSISCNKLVNFIKSVKIRLVTTCHLQTCYNLLKQLAASLWITSFDNQLATSLLITWNRLAINEHDNGCCKMSTDVL